MKINNISHSAVTNNINNYQNSESTNSKDKTESSSFNKETGNLYAADLNLCNASEDKKKKAQSMAMELMKNVFENDNKIDSEIQSRDDNIKKLTKENAESLDMLKSIEKERAVIKEGYGISNDSQEEQDLNLLRKERDSLVDNTIILTDEDKERLETIHSNGITDYQKEMLLMDSSENELYSRINENNKAIFADSAIIKEMHINRLKTHDMVDAKNQGDAIIEAANKEIMGDIIQQGVDESDEKMEEIDEIKEKNEEIKEKYEEYLEKKKEKDDEQEEMYELSQEYTEVHSEQQTSTLPDTKKSINQIINELNLTIDDIKGAVVDTDV